jgi:hypothetical protein
VLISLVLLAAIGFLIAALSPGQAALAWVSVGLSAVAAVMILRRWRRSWLQRRDIPEDESAFVEYELIVDAEASGTSSVGSHSVVPVAVTTPQQIEEGQPPAEQSGQAGDDDQPGEEDTDAADLLVVYELTDEVLVVDEHPRYHLARCRFPDRERAERLPVKEARKLGFTPCGRCRPDKVLARKHRVDRAATTGSG